MLGLDLNSSFIPESFVTESLIISELPHFPSKGRLVSGMGCHMVGFLSYLSFMIEIIWSFLSFGLFAFVVPIDLSGMRSTCKLGVADVIRILLLSFVVMRY